MIIRHATSNDIPGMVALSNLKRSQYEIYSPVFWRKAEGGADKQVLFFQAQLDREQNIILISEEADHVNGFVIASVIDAPPVYDPGGKVCMVDDFTVSETLLWATVGAALLAEATAQAKEKGAVLMVVVCGQQDEPKRQMLQGSGASVSSEWYVNPIA